MAVLPETKATIDLTCSCDKVFPATNLTYTAALPGSFSSANTEFVGRVICTLASLICSKLFMVFSNSPCCILSFLI